MAIKISVVCPACPQRLEFETDVEELWGFIPVLDTGCIEVTRPWAPEVEEHLTAHRLDGSLTEAMRKRYEYYAEHAPGIVERLTPKVDA